MKTILLFTLVGLIQLNLNSQNYLFKPNSSGFHFAVRIHYSITVVREKLDSNF